MARQSLLACSLFALSLTAGAPAVAHAQSAPVPAEAPAPAAADPAALEVAEAIRDGFRQYLFDPSLLSQPEFQAMEARMFEAAGRAESVDAFRRSFNRMWREGPISHVNAQTAQAPVEQAVTYFDTMRVGEGARLDWNGDIAVLTVNTMMGLDTIEQIDAAYAEIAARNPSALIIDLRANGGGAFALVPLVQHLLDAPLDVGAFVGRPWAAAEDRAPTLADAQAVEPWTGWSIRDFWRSIREERITRLTLSPQGPHYGGPVYVLISNSTASAAEIAADALKGVGRTTLIGERTEGQVLSQMPVDLPHGLHLFLPIADYYSFRSGRLEGQGVAPDIAVAADSAMDEALARARR
jgi:carboxyl-terminal processing protease